MKILLLHGCLLLSLTCAGQTRQEMDEIRKQRLYQTFELKEGNDTIRFFIIAKPGEAKQKKPLILYRQGSLPIPPFTRYTEGVSISALPANFYTYLKDYHMVVIAKPGVPLVMDSATVDRFFDQVMNRTFAPKKYLINNNLDYYVRTSSKVIDFLTRQAWVDKHKIVVIGGSEGYNVAAKLAVVNRSITHLICYSSHPYGRFDYLVKEQRHKALTGEITDEKAQVQIDSLYSLWKAICQDPKATNKLYYDTYYAWSSFSEPPINSLVQLQIPIFVAYGTRDDDWDIVEENDLLAIRFLQLGKTNLTLRPYLHCNHSLVEIKKNATGDVIGSVDHNSEFVTDYMNWLKKSQ